MKKKQSNLSSLQLQHDWENKENETFWISHSQKGEETVYAKLKFTEKNQAVFNDEDFKSNKATNFSVDVSYKDSYRCKFILPRSKFEHIHRFQSPILCLDLSMNSELGLSGSRDGNLRVWNAKSGEIMRDFVGHLSDVTVAKFLPSSKVIMSGAGDFLIKIWRISDSFCAVTLKGHKRTVSGLSFIDRGRNFCSCSDDACVKLWDCASQSEIFTVFKGTKPINNVKCFSDEKLSSNKNPSSQKMFNVLNNVVAFCSDDASLRLHDTVSKNEIMKFEASDQVNDFILFENTVWCGTQEGKLLELDIRKKSVIKTIETTNSILALNKFSESSFYVCNMDGQCYEYDINKNSLISSLSDMQDPVYACSSHGRLVWTGCRDGIIRKYISI